MPLPENWRAAIAGLPENLQVAFERGYLRGAREADRKSLDIGALRTLIDSMPRRCRGLSEPARVVAAERMRDAADAIEHDGEV